MKKLIIMAISILFLLPGIVFSAERELKPQTTCPVLGDRIDKNVYLDYEGQRIYFCCAGCKDTFLKEPEKYFKKIEEDGILLESIQKKCPVMGGDIDKKEYVDYKGRRVYFCCAGCKEKFDKEPEKYLKNIK
jgi:YHS domain-containing protein